MQIFFDKSNILNIVKYWLLLKNKNKLNNHIVTETRRSGSNEPREASKQFVHRLNGQKRLKIGENIEKNCHNCCDTNFYNFEKRLDKKLSRLDG